MDDATNSRLALLEAHADWLYKVAGYTSPYGHSGTQPTSTAVSGGDGFSAEVLELSQRGNKIGAIKRYREETGVGLKEAKDAVDRLG